MGNAICDMQNESIIREYAGNTLQQISSVDHVAELLNSDAYSEAGKAFSGYLSNAVTLKYQDSFHNNLNILERLNFMSQKKRIKYERTSTMLKTGTAFASQLLIDTIPTLVNVISNANNKNNLENFFITWAGYVNYGNPTSEILKVNLKSIFNALGLSYDDNRVNDKLRSVGSVLPSINRHNQTVLNSDENDNLISIAKMIISPADLSNSLTKDRATQFVTDLFKVSYNEAQNMMTDIMAAQEHLTQLLIFTSIDYTAFFNKLCKNASESVKLGKYNVEMDPYAQLRKRNGEGIIKIGQKIKENVEYNGKAIVHNIYNFLNDEKEEYMELKSPSGDIFKIANQMMNDTLRPGANDFDAYTDAMIEQKQQAIEAFNIPEDEDE